MPQYLLGNETVYHINPTGAFEIGGPDGDAGLTGRKIIVDTYGGAAPHGGGAFTGKDPTKVDRSAAYAAATSPRTSSRRASPSAARSSSPMRSAFPSRCRSMSIPTAPALSATMPSRMRSAGLRSSARLTPRGIRTHLGLNKPIYQPTAAYGHFGRKADGDHFPWERVDLIDDLKTAIAA